MRIMRMAEQISMFLVKIAFLISKILTNWSVGYCIRDAEIEISSILVSPLRHLQHNAGTSVILWTKPKATRNLTPTVKLVKEHVVIKFGKQVTLKDLKTFLESLKKKQKDVGAKRGVLVDEKDQLSVIFFAPHKCKNCLRSLNCFDIVLVDGTSNVNKVGMPLHFFMVEDESGHGRTVFYAAITKEPGWYLVKAFKECNTSYSKA